MIEELLKLRRQFIQLKMAEISSKVSIDLGSPLERSDYQLVRRAESRLNKKSLERSNYQLIKRKEGRK